MFHCIIVFLSLSVSVYLTLGSGSHSNKCINLDDIWWKGCFLVGGPESTQRWRERELIIDIDHPGQIELISTPTSVEIILYWEVQGGWVNGMESMLSLLPKGTNRVTLWSSVEAIHGRWMGHYYAFSPPDWSSAALSRPYKALCHCGQICRG